MIRSAAILFIAFSSALIGASARAESLRFEDLERLVREKNLHVRASNDFLLSSERREGFFFRSLLPKAYVEGGQETFQRELFRGTSEPYWFAQAELNLFNGTRDSLEEEIRESETEISRAERRQTIRDELLKAQVEFWQIAYLSELSSILDLYAARNQKNLASARRRIAAGSATESDQIEFEMTQRIIEQDKAKVRTQLSSAKKKLNVLIGKDPQETITFESDLPRETTFAFEQLNIEPKALSEVVVAEASARVAALKRSQSNRWWLPKVDAYSGYKQMNMRESDEFAYQDRQEYFIGVKLSLNIFDGGESLSEGSSQAAKAASLESKAVQSFRELSVEFETSKVELQQLTELVKATSKDVEIAEKFLNRILSEYSRGVKSGSEVLSASDRSYEFQKRHAELKKDFQVSKAKLLSLLSKEGL